MIMKHHNSPIKGYNSNNADVKSRRITTRHCKGYDPDTDIIIFMIYILYII